MKVKLSFPFFTLLLSLNLSELVSSQNTNNPCEIEMIDRTIYDLSKMRNQHADYNVFMGRYTYKANFCGPLNNQCITSPKCPAAMFLRGNACVNRYTTEWKPHAEYIDQIVKAKGIRLTFPDGDKCYLGFGSQKLTYILNCDKMVDVQFERIEKVTTCIVNYHFNTKYACPEFAVSPASSFKYSPVDILLGLVILFLIYLVGFTYSNYKNNPEDGLIKNLPHRDFWSNFFENISFGMSSSFNYIRSLFSKENSNSGSYV
jgi:hypothetical protein